MSRLQDLLLRSWSPHILLICWIIFLGVTMWDHTSRIEVLHLYDPLTYLQKDINF